MVQNNEENALNCNCANCPSKNECMAGNKQFLYCAQGKTDCAIEANGCVCAKCIIHSENNLSGGYFCAKGAAE